MNAVVRSIDVGFGNTKYVMSVSGAAKFRCAYFPSVAPSSEADPRASLGAGRKTAVIPIDGLYYEVGPDAQLAANIYQTTPMHDDYCESAEYLALVRGALSFMKVDTIDLLVVGLPVSTYLTKRQALERRLRGPHPLSAGRVVEVKRVKVMAQPQGALMYYGHLNNKMADLNAARNLVIDPGARTFDWLVARGTRIIEKRSGSANRGMFDVLHCLAEAIGTARHTNYRDYERIDAALRTDTKPKVFGKDCDLAPFMRSARKITEDAVNEMRRSVGDGNDIDNIHLVGGASFFYRDAVRAAFQHHNVIESPDPMYANLRGFQIAGQTLADTLPVAADATSTATTPT